MEKGKWSFIGKQAKLRRGGNKFGSSVPDREGRKKEGCSTL